MALLTTSQIIDQAMQAAGNTNIQTWCLAQLNAFLRRFHRKNSFPFLQKLDETLTTTASQAYTSYATITDFWKPRIVQFKVGTTLYPVRPLPGGLAAYFADTSRLVGSSRPSRYALDRANARIYWADGIPSAVETIDLFYQAEQANLALADTPAIVTHTEGGELFLIYALQKEIKIRMGEFQEAAALSPLAKLYEDEVLAQRLDDEDEVPEENLNKAYT